jgi:hypothetical protein
MTGYLQHDVLQVIKIDAFSLCMPSQLRYFGDKIRLVLLKGAELKIFLCEHSLQLLEGHFPYAPAGYTVKKLKKALLTLRIK